jgi:HSP20 family molecular chaperone IbpA
MTNNATIQKTEQKAERGKPEVTRGSYYTPRVDILETENEMTLYVDLPGVKAEDVNLHFENGELAIHAHCAPRQEKVNYLLSEYGVGDFYRVFTISESVNAEKINAEVKNGVLTVHLPKTEAVKPRRIQVKGE